MWNRKIQVPILAVGMSAVLALGACTSDASADATTDAATVPGYPVQTYYSTEGAVTGIAGLDSVSAPEIIRSQPNFAAPQVSQVWRTGAVELAGHEWRDADGPDATYWAEVRLDGVQGWMPSNHLYYFGGTGNVTGDYADIAPADDPYKILATIGWRATDNGGRWAVVTTPADTGDGLYRVDITGMPDDAQAGERLRVALGYSDGNYRVASVDQTLLCARGVTGGLCL